MDSLSSMSWSNFAIVSRILGFVLIIAALCVLCFQEQPDLTSTRWLVGLGLAAMVIASVFSPNVKIQDWANKRFAHPDRPFYKGLNRHM